MNRMIWHTVEDVEKEDRREALVAMGLTSWASCSLEKPPAHFGVMMALIGKKLGIIPLPDNFRALADEILHPA